MYQENQQFNTSSAETSQKRKRSGFWDFLLCLIVIALVVVLLARLFVVSKVTVSGESMTASYYSKQESPFYKPELTYHDGDTVTVNKLAKPMRGDVVVFYKYPVESKFLAMFGSSNDAEENGKYYKLIKRVVAVGGDKLWVENTGLPEGQFRLVVQTSDGQVLHEDYYRKNGVTLSADCFIISTHDVKSGLGRLANCTEDNPLVIEQGYFFAMGDNRDNSADSRGELGAVSYSQLFGVVIDNKDKFFVKGSYSACINYGKYGLSVKFC